jgi:hypothetical protein
LGYSTAKTRRNGARRKSKTVFAPPPGDRRNRHET